MRIAALRQYVAAPQAAAHCGARSVRHPHASLTPGGLATLLRRLGNRGMGALIQRLTVPTTQPEAGENTATAAQEQAELHAAAQHRADARRLLPAELEEVSAMAALTSPQGPGIVLGTGTKKLLDALSRLGSGSRLLPSHSFSTRPWCADIVGHSGRETSQRRM